MLDAACRGEIDVVMNVGLSADRTRCMVYTAAAIRTGHPVLDAACRGEIDVVMNVGLSADRTR
ncbi:hypothetical protein C7E12_23080, partial [Stenotrophomonas maltophilia]